MPRKISRLQISTTSAGNNDILVVDSGNFVLKNLSNVYTEVTALRLRSYSNANLSSLTSGTGDVIYNTSIRSIQVYNGNAWVTPIGADPIDPFLLSFL